MHPYFSQFTQHDVLWSPPPDVDDPAWQQAFDNATEQAKRSIANNWLWLINKDTALVASTMLVAWIGKYTEFYAKIAPYVDSNMFSNARLRGTFDDFKRVLRSVNDSDKLYELLRECWFNEHKNIDSFRSLYDLFVSQRAFAGQDTTPYYPVFQKLLWNQVAVNAADELDWLEIAVLMSAQCGLEGINPTDKVGNYVDDRRSLAWQKLGYLVRYVAKESKQDKANQPVLSVITATNPVTAVKAFKPLLEFALRGAPGAPPVLKPGTIFNESKAELTNVYPMLRQFIPALTSIWDSAESLEMPYTLAFDSYLNTQTKVISPSLPDDLNCT